MPGPFTPPTGTWPPLDVTTLQNITKAYLYWEYNDDENIQAFVDSFNGIAQDSFLDWFNSTPLAVYTSLAIFGALLDWIGQGIYGYARPALPSGKNQNIGPYNTFLFNQLDYNQELTIGDQNLYTTTDDIYKRILTWHLYKGDGKVFTIPWLKRRVMRFLFGTNGTDPPVDQTYPVSVTFGVDGQVNINIARGLRTITGGAVYNMSDYNTFNYNQIFTTFSPEPVIPEAVIFKAAVDAGVLELPFQFTWTVNVA